MGPRAADLRPRSLVGRCALAALLAWLGACSTEPPARLVVAHRLLDGRGAATPQDGTGGCELDSEAREALGCLPAIYGADPGIVVDGSVLRRHYGTPPEVVGREVVVESKLLFGPNKRSKKLINGVVLGEPLGAEFDVGYPLPPDTPLGVADLQYRLRPIPPATQAFEMAPLAVAPGAVLEVGVGLDPLGFWVGASAVEMEVVARAGAREVVVLRTVLDPQDPTTQRWKDLRADLGALAGQTVRLVLRSRVLAAPGQESAFAFGFPLWATPMVLEPRRGDPRPRNVVLISLDTLRADFLGTYGSRLPTSPSIDRFAGQGALFERAFATYPSTLFSHMNMLTGVYPGSLGEFDVRHPLAAEIPTLPEVLARERYRTAAITEDGYIVPKLGFRRGFDSYRENRGIEIHDAKGFAAETFGAGLAWLREHRDESFFLFLHTYQVHWPYTPPVEYDQFRAVGDSDRGMPVAGEPLPAARDRHRYAGEVLYTDAELQRLLDGLVELGLDDSTLVVITADHGEAFGEHGLVGHANGVYDELLHVPLILRAPGLVPPGVRIAANATVTDVVPTVLDLLGIAIPPNVQGASLVPLLRDPSAPSFAERPIYAEFRRRRGPTALAVRRGRYKWIREGGEAPSLVAFDLGADPRELAPLDAPELLAQGEALHAEYVAAGEAVRARLAQARGGQPAPAEVLDEATAAKLRALGYID